MGPGLLVSNRVSNKVHFNHGKLFPVIKSSVEFVNVFVKKNSADNMKSLVVFMKYIWWVK